jgi:hypothetical protein
MFLRKLKLHWKLHFMLLQISAASNGSSPVKTLAPLCGETGPHEARLSNALSSAPPAFGFEHDSVGKYFAYRLEGCELIGLDTLKALSFGYITRANASRMS